MNQKKIKKEYSKAWNLLKESELFNSPFYVRRDLYDFFDEQGIYCSVYPEFDRNNNVKWYWAIDIIEEDIHTDKFFIFRQEAEEQAFLKAFEILENHLKEKQNEPSN